MTILAIRLAAYLTAVLAVVSPHLNSQRAASIARDVATVTVAQERAFDDDASGQKTGLLLISLAYWETGKSWAKWVDDGRCNDPLWRVEHTTWMKNSSGCDNANAYSMWQVHVPNDSIEAGQKLVRNRQLAIAAALVNARASLKKGVGLCAYSGERGPDCPKAKRRLDTTLEWAARFPFDPEIAEK